MKYLDYINLKLKNSSKTELTNFSITQSKINFNDTNGFIPRKTKDIDKNKNSDKYDAAKELSRISNSTVKSLDSQRSKDSIGNSFGETKNKPQSIQSKFVNNNLNINKTNSNNQPKTSPSQSNKSTTSTNKTTSNSNTEKRTVKNWYGDNVEFEKRDGKWYRSGTNEEVGKTGKWKSYFDEKTGVKNVRNTKPTKSSKGKVTVGKIKVEYDNEKDYVDNLGNTKRVTTEEAESINKNNNSQKLKLASEVNSIRDKEFANLKLNYDLGHYTESDYKRRYKELIDKYGISA